jgi:DNA invertase Pin-like site-specific DNA recombinase
MSRAKSSGTRRAVGYVRVSQVGSRGGDNFHSPEVQRERIEAWAAYRDYAITKWYIDLDVSGTGKVRRPEFERMMADARERRFDAVAVYRLTRFARNLKDAAARYAELRELGISLVSVTEDIDTTTASGQFVQNMLFAMAEFESQRIGEEWRNVLARRRRQGIATVTKHITGYRQHVDPQTGKKSATLDEIEPREAEAVRLMFSMRDEGCSYTAIQKALGRDGYRPRLGGSRFSTVVIGQILKNPLYAGYLRGDDGELVEAKHEPIVSLDVWERVQALAPQAIRTNRFGNALLSGLLVCSGCGYAMQYATGGRRSNGYHRPDAYRCPSRQRVEPCPQGTSVQGNIADAYVEEAFLSRFDPKRMPNGGKVKTSPQQRAWKAQLGRARARVQELDTMLDDLAEQRFRHRKLDPAYFERQAARWLEEREQEEERARDLEGKLAVARPLERNVLDLWDALPPVQKRRAFRIVIESIRVLPAPRRGKSQAELLPERFEIAWLQ